MDLVIGSAGAARSLTLTALVRSAALTYPNGLAILDGPMRIDFAALDRRTDRLAAAIAGRGVAAGERVAMLLLDGLASIELLIACGKLGAIALPMNWRLAPAEIAHILDAAAPSLLFHSACFADLLPPGAAAARIELPDATRNGGVYEGLIADAPAGTPPPRAGDEALFMLFTSGTTGLPKGCLLSQMGAAASGLALALRLGIGPTDRLLSTMPLFHVAGLSHVFAALAAGAGTVFAPREASVDESLRLVVDERCSFGLLPDVLLEGWREVAARRGLPLALRTVMRGSSMTSAESIARVADAVGAQVVGGYGQTEVLGFSLTIGGEQMTRHPTALGSPLPHLEAAVLDDDGYPIDGPAAGELGLRGASVMLGYWRDDAATRAALGTGWLRTGDLVRRDDSGMFHFVSRAKELIKTGGENVYPVEVEQVLLAHPAIADAAIVGVPDPRWVEAVKACIVVAPGQAITPSEAVAWCRSHIAGYKRPRYVEFVESIPRDHLGKIQRPLLRQRPVTPDQAVR